MLILILNIVHIVLIFIPILIYFIPLRFVKPLFKFILLGYIINPLLWALNDNNECLLTKLSKKNGDMKDSISTSEFSEKYMKWLYNPILHLINKKWNKNNIDIIAIVHYSINLILLWIYMFFVHKCNLF